MPTCTPPNFESGFPSSAAAGIAASASFPRSRRVTFMSALVVAGVKTGQLPPFFAKGRMHYSGTDANRSSCPISFDFHLRVGSGKVAVAGSRRILRASGYFVYAHDALLRAESQGRQYFRLPMEVFREA